MDLIQAYSYGVHAVPYIGIPGFLGLANWYIIYIHKYADYAAPLMEALSGKYQYEPISPDKKGTLDGNGKPVKRKKLKLPPKTDEDHVECPND